MRILIIIFLLVNALISFAQKDTCDCVKDFYYAKNYMENNYVGFKYRVKDKSDYVDFCKQIEFEIKKDTINCYTYFDKYFSYFKDNHTFVIDNQKKQTRNKTKENQKEEILEYDFTIKQDVAILRLSNFMLSNDEISKFYDSVFSELKKVNYLIIDIRNNFGGASHCIRPLIPLFYTNPIIDEYSEIYVTKENIKQYENDLKQMDTVNYGIESIREMSDIVKRMKQSDSILIPLSPRDTIFVSKSDLYENIQKVAIWFNKNTASISETLIYYAKQSKKTILVGENSYGAVGFGNSQIFITPSLNYECYYSTVIYPDLVEYEYYGFIPTIKLDNNKNTIYEIIKILKD